MIEVMEDKVDDADTRGALSPTQRALWSMLVENTGQHMCDSGGEPDGKGGYRYGYGRNWQRNQKRDFEAEEATSLCFSLWPREPKDGEDQKVEIEMTHSVYHWLTEKLTLDTQADDAFHGTFLTEVDQVECETCGGAGKLEDKKKFSAHVWEYRRAEDGTCQECDGSGHVASGKGWLELMEEFPEWFAKHLGMIDASMEECEECRGTGEVEVELNSGENGMLPCPQCSGKGEIPIRAEVEIGGIYGEGEPMTVNTCNGEDGLSQTIQYVYFEVEGGESYVVLQVHGGADVRGGYTKPRVFTCNDELSIFDNAKGSIYCEGHETRPGFVKDSPQLALDGVALDEPHASACGDHKWDSDDCCNFRDETWPRVKGAERELDENPAKALSEEDWTWEPGKIGVFVEDVKIGDKVYKEGTGLCPFCGGILSGGFF